ncbi:MAG: glycosyltransferase family 2 protein [Phycisphaerales bacterium]
MHQASLPISVCMIVRNEAARLPATLKALTSPDAPAFAEIRITDTGSTDDTIAICRQLSCAVTSEPWQGFARTRRLAFQKASQPWILWIDADEVMTLELRHEMARVFQSGMPACAGFEINRISRADGRWIRHGDWFPDWNLRLFRAGEWSIEDRSVHESVSVRGEVQRLRGLLEHHTFRGWTEMRTRSERYAQLWAEQERAHARRTWPGFPTVRAMFAFLRGYVFRAGVLDGVPGLRIALNRAYETRLKHALLRGS